MCIFAYGFSTGIPLNILIIYVKDPNLNIYISIIISLYPQKSGYLTYEQDQFYISKNLQHAFKHF